MECASRRFRRPFADLVVLVLVATVLVRAQNHQFDLLTASVADIQAAVGTGALTYERLVELYLSRIEAYDKKARGSTP